MGPLPFVKMHGLGNDFVVFDGRRSPIAISETMARSIADRRTGVGCDQVIVIESSKSADALIRIHNADGGEVEACGNATRCVATLLMTEDGGRETIIESPAGMLHCQAAGADTITVDMGVPGLEWRNIPLSRTADTLALDLGTTTPSPGCAVSMGNPHVVFFGNVVEKEEITRLGRAIEHHPLFPQRTNVELARVLAEDRIRVKVWERGVGVTRACGTGACATLVAACRRGLSARRAEIVLDGGSLRIEWRNDDHVLMTGPAATSFNGTWPADQVR